MAGFIRKSIPNTITCCNLLCGCLATVEALNGNYLYALLFIILGNVFDFFDGFSARLLKVSSPLGKELDSLADVVTSGIAPASMLFSYLSMASVCQIGTSGCPVAKYFPYLAFLIAAFSALRLAKFNLDTRQTTSFIGLPTPANALFWASLIVAADSNGISLPTGTLAVTAIIGIILSCYLLIAEIPMFALKFKHFGWKGNELRYCFIVASAVLLILLQTIGFAAVIILYVILSAANNALSKKTTA